MHAEDGGCPFCGASQSSAVAPIVTSLVLGIALAACGPTVDADGTGSTGSSTGGASGASVTVSGPSPTGPNPATTDDIPPDPSVPTSMTTVTDSADTVSTNDDDNSGDEGCAFYGCPPDGGSVTFECDLIAQDCPEGEKCMPWANDGGNLWNASRCSPVDPTAGQAGDPCTVEGGPYSGIDSCDVGAMCWNVDRNTNEGECVDLCIGSLANLVCEGDESLSCVTGYGDAILVCLPPCDPLVQDCGVGAECIPWVDTFVCVPDLSGDEGAVGEVCEATNGCDPGLFCADPDQVPGCVGVGCCAELCDLAAENPDEQCSQLEGGVTCSPWEPPYALVPSLGACVLPQ